MSDADNKYRLDKTAFAVMSFEESDNHYGHWKNKSYSERLDAAFFFDSSVIWYYKQDPN